MKLPVVKERNKVDRAFARVFEAILYIIVLLILLAIVAGFVRLVWWLIAGR